MICESQTGGDNVQLRLHLPHLDAGLQARYRLQPAMATANFRRIKPQWYAEVRVLFTDPKSFGKNTDNRDRFIVDSHGAANDSRIASKTTTPEMIPQQCDSICVGSTLFLAKIAAKRKTHTQRRNQARGHSNAIQTLRFIDSRESVREERERTHVSEELGFTAEINKIRKRETLPGRAALRKLLPNHH